MAFIFTQGFFALLSEFRLLGRIYINLVLAPACDLTKAGFLLNVDYRIETSALSMSSFRLVFDISNI